MSITNKDLKDRMLEISKKLGLSHIGSCVTAVDIIEEIYQKKKDKDLFVLSSGHAALALYVVLEKHLGHDAEELFHLHGVHPNRDAEHDIHCSTGSLGQGLPIALGMAMADPSRRVYCQISDGECAEGSIWEALRIKTDNRVENLRVYANLNGFSAYDSVDIPTLISRLKAFCPDINIRLTDVEQYPFLSGVDAHYCKVPEKKVEFPEMMTPMRL